MQEAEKCILQALRLGHEQSTRWTLAFNVCPIAIWRGELAEASHFANLLLEILRVYFSIGTNGDCFMRSSCEQ